MDDDEAGEAEVTFVKELKMLIGLVIPVVCIILGRFHFLPSCALPPSLDRSAVSVSCHDDQDLAFAHLLERRGQRDQVRIALVTGLP